MNDNERKGIEAALQRYFDGHSTGDPRVMRAAFHDSARLQFLADGKYKEWSLDDYLAKLPGAPADDESERRRRIANVEVGTSTASASVELDYPNARFLDHMTLLRIDGDWTIVNKVFEMHPKS